MAHTSIPLQELTLTEESTTIIPPDSSEELFEVDWEDVAAGIQASPAEYLLRIRGGEGYEDTTPLIPLICHRVKVQRSEVTSFWCVILLNHSENDLIFLQAPLHAQWNDHDAMGRVRANRC